MFDPKQPLWLPPGSVRALLALSLVGALIAFDPTKIGELAAVAVGFYFAKALAKAS